MNHIPVVVVLPLLLGGCATTSIGEIATYDDGSSPAFGVTPIHYSTPVSGYAHRVPVDPKPWREQNDAQAPRGDAS